MNNIAKEKEEALSERYAANNSGFSQTDRTSTSEDSTSNTSISTPRQDVNSGQTENSGNGGQARKSPADMLIEAARDL